MARDTHKSFGSSRPEPKIGPTFDVSGEGWTEEFHCKPSVPGRVVPDFLAAISVGKGKMSNPDMVAFIHDCLAENVLVTDAQPADGEGDAVDAVYEDCDDRARWDALMDDETRPVHAQEISAIALWLIDQYYDRPTSPPRR